jgi:hypothetical protein
LIRVADGFRFGLETLIDRARRRAVKQRIVSIGFLERMHVLPLEVLDDLNFARAAIVERLHLRRYAREAGKLRCTEPPCSHDQLEVLTQGPYEDRLQEPVRPNARCELVEVVEALTWIRRGLADPLEREAHVLRLDGCGVRRHVHVLSLRWGAAAPLHAKRGAAAPRNERRRLAAESSATAGGVPTGLCWGAVRAEPAGSLLHDDATATDVGTSG